MRLPSHLNLKADADRVFKAMLVLRKGDREWVSSKEINVTLDPQIHDQRLYAALRYLNDLGYVRTTVNHRGRRTHRVTEKAIELGLTELGYSLAEDWKGVKVFKQEAHG